MQNFSAPSDRTGFTLLEMMSALGVILILCTLLVPALGWIQEKSKATACVSNLRQIGMLCHTYAADNENALPGGANTGSINWGDIWVYKLVPYFPPGGHNSAHLLWASLLKCPSNKSFATYGTSYGPVMGNENFYGRCAGGMRDASKVFSMSRLSNISHPSKTPYWVEIDNVASSDGIDPSNQPFRQLKDIHSKGSNVLMTDGHVQRIPAAAWNLSGEAPHPWAFNFALDYPKPDW